MTRAKKWLAAPLVGALVLAACGGSDEATDTTEAPAVEEEVEAEAEPEAEAEAEPEAEAGGEGLAAAQAVVDANLVIPSDIGPTIALDSAPEEKTVAWLECSLPSCIAIGVGFADAVETLGWNLEVISFATDAAPAFQQALDQGVDYVAITGTAPALIQDQLDQATAAGVPVMSCFDASEPAEGGFAMQCGDATAVEAAGKLISNAIIADSGGTANVMMVNIPDFTVLKVEADASRATYEANCPDCVFTELALTLDQLLAGEVAGAILSSLQADPDIEYVHFAFDGLAGGVSSVLADAELLDGLKLVGVDYNGAILQEIVDGTMQFWTTNPKEYSAWLMVDAMARHSVGMDNPEERANAVVPTFIANSPEVAEPLIPTDGWRGPDGMAEQFAALWGV